MSNKDVTRGINTEGFEDPRGVFPKKDYYNSASTNKASRGLDRNELYNGGGHKHVDLKLNSQGPSQYPYNLVQQTVSGIWGVIVTSLWRYHQATSVHIGTL